MPTYGSKEAIFLLAQVVLDRDADKSLVLTTQPGYPVPDRGAVLALAGEAGVESAVKRAGGCARPVRLKGETAIIATRTGEVLSVHLIEPGKAYWRNQNKEPGRWPGSSE